MIVETEHYIFNIKFYLSLAIEVVNIFAFLAIANVIYAFVFISPLGYP